MEGKVIIPPSQKISRDVTIYANMSDSEKVQQLLKIPLGAEHLASRAGYGQSGDLTYVEGWKTIELANSLFGFNGWSCSICDLTPDYVRK